MKDKLQWPITALTNRTATNIWKQKWEEKQLYGYFKRQNDEISHKKTWTWPRNGNFKRGTECLFISAQNNAIRTNYVKAKINKKQKRVYVQW